MPGLYLRGFRVEGSASSSATQTSASLPLTKPNVDHPREAVDGFRGGLKGDQLP